MKSIAILFIFVALCATAVDSCYAAPGVFTGWCDANKAIFGHDRLRVYYCFSIKGDMSMRCEVMASNYPGAGIGRWKNFDVGVINDGDCVKMYWGANSAVPSARCWSYGLPVNFDFHIE